MSSSDSTDDLAAGRTHVRPSGEHPAVTPHTQPVPRPADDSSMPGYVDPIIGCDVAGYRVKQRLGVGGMGIVYEGEHAVIGKRVAIKVLRPELADNPEVVERLVAEARAVNQVGHRGIIDVFGYGRLPDGRQCIVMEFLEGQALSELLEENQRQGRTMTEREVLGLLEEILSALSAAHGAGVIHRDLKPSNIYICRQRDGGRFVKLLDFGIAKLGALGGASPQARASMLVGTPSYMAPEQAMGSAATPAMDLYAVGVMAFEMLTNRLPFVADSVVEVLLMHGNTPAPRPSSLMPGLSDGADELVLRLMAKKPEDRFPTAEHVRARVLALKVSLGDPGSVSTVRLDEHSAPTPTAGSAPSLTGLRRPRTAIAGIVVMVGLTAALGISFFFSAAPEAPHTPPPTPERSSAPLLEPLPAAHTLAPVAPPPTPAPVPPAPPSSPEPAATAVPPARPQPATRAPQLPSTTKPSRSVASASATRLDRLEARIARAHAAGTDVELFRRQVKKVRERLSQNISPDEAQQLEAIISRLEQTDAF